MSCTVAVEHLLALLKNNVARQIPTIVFCNKSTTTCFLSYFLNNNNVHHVCLHADMPEKVGIFIVLACRFLFCFHFAYLKKLYSLKQFAIMTWSHVS